jgi:extracellular factor (EF) 3-hydroxypalmitic acid methyl ester biosynthesis protein
MNQEMLTIDAWLMDEEKRIPINARFASKYSLWIRFNNGHNFKNGADFSKLILKLNDEIYEMGPCRLISKPNIDGFAGRLILMQDFHDFERLFLHNRLEKLQTAFFNLPLLLAHKDEIHQHFKDFVSDMTYDLNVFKNLFDKLDSEYRQEPDDIKQVVQRAILESEGPKLMSFLDDRLMKLEEEIAYFSKAEHERHGFYFRKQLWNIILTSPLMARTNLKPRGYSGDSAMMRMVYENKYQGSSTFAKIMHKHPIEQPAAQAVRNRRRFIAQKLCNFIRNHETVPREKLKILSVACGPAFELYDTVMHLKDIRHLHFTMFDQDQLALLEVAKLVDRIEKKIDSKVNIDYLKESVRTMLFTKQLKSKWGQFDFIYSMGLFDYLTPPVATAILKKLYSLLKPGGELIVGNFHVSNPTRYYMEYWLDWVIYYRTEEDFLNLFRESEENSNAKVDLRFDKTGIQMFLHITRKDADSADTGIQQMDKSGQAHICH